MAARKKAQRVPLDRHLRARGIPASALLSKEEKAAIRKQRAKTGDKRPKRKKVKK